MPARADIDRILATNRYCVLGTADGAGRPWATPVFFAPLDADRMCWVSSADSRHSRNIAVRSAVAITVFDSTVPVGGAEAAYFDADATIAPTIRIDEVMAALNARLPTGKELSTADLHPAGPLVAYQASVHRRYVLVRGGNAELRNVVDMTVEV